MLQPCASTTARSCAHVLGVTPPALGRGHEVVGEAQVVIDLDEQVREADRPHLLGQPFPQVAQPRLRRGVQRLGGVRGQVPAVLIHRGVGVVGRRLEEEVVGRVQPLRQIVADVLGVGGQAGPLEEGLPERLPALLREEVVLEPAEPLAVLDREVARPQVVLELQQQGALPRLPVRLAVGHDQGQEPLRDEVRGGVLGEFSLQVGVHLLEDPKGLQAGDLAVAGVREELQGAEQDRRELPQVAEPPDEAVEHVALLAGDPLVQPRHLGLQGVSGHGGEQPRTQGGVADGVVQDDRPQGPQRGQGRLDRLTLAAHLVVQLVLGPGVGPGEELVEHVHRLIDGVAVALPEEADQGREAAGPGDLAKAVRRALADVVEQGALVIGVQPGEIDGQDAGGLDGGQLVGEALHGGRRGLGRVGLDRLEAGNRLPFLHLQQAVEGLRPRRAKGPRPAWQRCVRGPASSAPRPGAAAPTRRGTGRAAP